MDYDNILFKWYPEDSTPIANERDKALDHIVQAVGSDPTIERKMRILGLQESQSQFIQAIRNGDLS